MVWQVQPSARQAILCIGRLLQLPGGAQFQVSEALVCSLDSHAALLILVVKISLAVIRAALFLDLANLNALNSSFGATSSSSRSFFLTVLTQTAEEVRAQESKSRPVWIGANVVRSAAVLDAFAG